MDWIIGAGLTGDSDGLVHQIWAEIAGGTTYQKSARLEDSLELTNFWNTAWNDLDTHMLFASANVIVDEFPSNGDSYPDETNDNTNVRGVTPTAGGTLQDGQIGYGTFFQSATGATAILPAASLNSLDFLQVVARGTTVLNLDVEMLAGDTASNAVTQGTSTNFNFTLGDGNGDGAVDVIDIDDNSDGNASAVDYDSSSVIDDADRTFLVESVIGTKIGDTNLDFDVDLDDVIVIGPNFGQPGVKTWNDGDFDGNGTVDLDDVIALGLQTSILLV